MKNIKSIQELFRIFVEKKMINTRGGMKILPLNLRKKLLNI